MNERFLRDEEGIYNAWSADQLTRSQFFHQKLHEWGLLEVAKAIETVSGEQLDWDLKRLGITEAAWKKAIHRGIRPVIVFAHPHVLQTLPRAVGYYRMLAMVSQKSMHNVGHRVERFENGEAVPTEQQAWEIATHLNRLISALVETDTTIDQREFDLWRGMAAGARWRRTPITD